MIWQRLNCLLGRHIFVPDDGFAASDVGAGGTCACGLSKAPIIWSRGPMPRLPSKSAVPIIDRIQSITVKPGDTLAISVDQNITREQAVQIKAACDIGIPGVKVVVLSRGMSLCHIAAPQATGECIAPAPHPAEVIGFDAWMRERTEQAHAAYMERHAAGGINYATLPMSINASAYMRRSEHERMRAFALGEVMRHFGVSFPRPRQQ